MRVRVLGAGWYGCHLTSVLLDRGHDVELHESSDRLFAGASGANPARLHMGFHYPRSGITRLACLRHLARFMEKYGALTRAVPVNIYAVASVESLVDFGTYRQTMKADGLEFLTIHDPREFGLREIDGALQTNERHIVVDDVRRHFEALLAGHVTFGASWPADDEGVDLTIDCTFCSSDNEHVDRYEPCLTVLVSGGTDVALTVMDGPFPSIYPWDEARGLNSLTSASLTPISKSCRTYAAARRCLDDLGRAEIEARAQAMLAQMSRFWPASAEIYKIEDFLLSIRAQPKSAADARYVDVVQSGPRRLRVRAGKIAAVFHAEAVVMRTLSELAAA